MTEAYKTYCRAVQAGINVVAKTLPWRKAIRVQGKNAVGKIPKLLRLCHMAKPLVVTDENLIKNGVAGKVLAVLDAAKIPYEVFSGVLPDPNTNTVQAMVQAYVAAGCNGFIAVGGGSPIDAAKAAAARIALPHKSLAQMGGLLKIRKKLPPFIAIPTTAGTGSETTIAAVITDSETNHKYALMDICLVPRYAVLDAQLTVGLPPFVTATTGMDAFAHAVEAYLCTSYNTPESIGLAKEAIAEIYHWLPVAYKNGSNMAARTHMQHASYSAGYAFSRAGVGNVHALAHALGAVHHLPHGLVVAVLLPVILRDYGVAVTTKLAQLAQLTGVASGQTEEADAEDFIAAIEELNRSFAIPQGLDCINEEDIPQMAKWAEKEANPLYPVPVIYSEEKFAEIIGEISGQ